MSARNSDTARAAEIVEAIAEARARIDHFGITRERFLQDDGIEMRALADSLLMCVYRVTEEAGNMSAATRAAHPEIDWRAIHGMRNILAHDYGNVDREIVWEAVQTDFDVLEAFCRAYLEECS